MSATAAALGGRHTRVSVVVVRLVTAGASGAASAAATAAVPSCLAAVSHDRTAASTIRVLLIRESQGKAGCVYVRVRVCVVCVCQRGNQRKGRVESF